MRKYPKELVMDNQHIWYLDDKSISKERITFEDMTYQYIPRSTFYTFNDNSDYIIKIGEPLIFFQDYRIKRMIELFANRKKIEKVDLPIAYYKVGDHVKGTIIPFYKDAISLKKILKIYAKELEKFYYHSDNKIKNVLLLYMEILDLLWELYDNNICYTDIHKGNFIIYDNQVKIIDFEPNYVHYKRNNKSYRIIIEKYCHLINEVNYFLGINSMLIFSCDSFYKTKEKIKELYKKI